MTEHTAIDWEAEEARRKREIYVLTHEDFMRKWMPQDRADAARMSADLGNLLRMVAGDASKQANDTLHKMLAIMPTRPLIGTYNP